jgi:hypothetical protein
VSSVHHVTAIWDQEAGVFVSQSTIPGLVIEAETFDEFMELVRALAPEIIAQNLPTAARPYKVQVQAERDLLLDVA